MIVECDFCHKKFNKFKKHIERCTHQFCSVKCHNEFRAETIVELVCKTCDKKFSRSHREALRTKNHFCSHSCSASYTNRNRATRKTKKCKSCGSLITCEYTYCKNCIKQRKHIHSKIDETKTIAYYRSIGENQNYRYVRSCAKKATKNREQKCQHCGYNKHIEVCHTRKISDFPETATILEINAEKNLLLLCPNCHWEFDNGLLKIGPEGLAPP